MADGTVSLNYLYFPNINSMFDQSTMEQLLDLLRAFSQVDYQRVMSLNPNLKQRLEQHKFHITQKIKEFGQYNDLNVSNTDDIKEASKREYILKKYL